MSTHDNGAYDKLREEVVRAIQPIVGLMDVYPAADAALKVIRDEIEAMIHGGDYYEQFELGRTMKLLDADTLLAKVSDDHAR